LEHRDRTLHHRVLYLKNRLVESTGDVMKDREVLHSSKVYHRVNEMLHPFNSFHGISNSLNCATNKKDVLDMDHVL
jgi:hypothetical protein